MSLDDLVANRQIEAVEADSAAAEATLAEGARHILSAEQIAKTDPNGAYQLGQKLDAMRRRRNRSEYGRAYFESREVEDAVDSAQRLIAAVEQDLRSEP